VGASRSSVPRRRVTQPKRAFTVDALARLARGERRRLVQVLVTQFGGKLAGFQQTAGHDEFELEIAPLWRERRLRIRIATRPVDQAALDRLEARVLQGGDAEGVMIAPFGIAGAPRPAKSVMVVGPGDLLERLERSALISWPDGTPRPALERVALDATIQGSGALLDPVGIRWLVALAHNELPPDLAGLNAAPQDLLERTAFRLLTASLRFGGRRYGERDRGKALPDAVLEWTEQGERLAAILDCKASADGYAMSSDHRLRFSRYVDALKPELTKAGAALRYVVVLSSEFSGPGGRRHPYHGRARELREANAVKLVYLRAADVVRMAVAVESGELSPAQREALAWSQAFARGRPSVQDLNALLPEAGA
jgi:hypothetical protein